jgi:catechol 2,3-dioxygenase-like lactoylglutathione lyase family enzyme
MLVAKAIWFAMVREVMKHIRTDHLHFFATDLDEAIKFYTDMGFEFVHKLEHGGRAAAQLKSETGLIIDINLTGVADNPGFSHYAILVDDIEKAAEELKAKGYEMDGPTTNKDTKRKIITVRDPNGFLVQFVQNE